MKYAPYSHSKMETYSCPKKFDYQYIKKIRGPKVDNPALKKGSYFHHLLEHYGQTVPDFEIEDSLREEVQTKYEEFLNGPLAKYITEYATVGVEVSYGLDDSFNPCSYYSKRAIFRGFIDRIVKGLDGKFYLIDWKSSKYKDLQYQSFDQLIQYGVWFFRTYPVDELFITYVYVEHSVENKLLLKREYLKNYAKSLSDKIRPIEADTEFKPNVTRLCDWCDFKELCESERE